MALHLRAIGMTAAAVVLAFSLRLKYTDQIA